MKSSFGARFLPLELPGHGGLALPFAYLHFRSGSIAGYVFSGASWLASASLLNNVFGYAGNLQNWSPGLPLPRQGSFTLCCHWLPLAGWCCGLARRSPFWRANFDSTSMTEPTSAVVLFRMARDPLARPIEAVAARIKADHPSARWFAPIWN